MTAPGDLGRLSALDTAAAVREGRLTAREVTEAALARITERDPAVHAVTVVRAEAARADAAALDAAGPGHDGPLAGVPVAIKEELDVAGMVTTFGGRGNTTPAAADSEVVRRLRAAGAVVVAKTAMPEFGQFPFTESAAHGTTRNPWDTSRSTGGSSGGSAAAVATGMVPVAMGGDGGGSIRIPSSCCGLVGLKPARGRVSTAPNAALWGALGTLGPLTRTVADTALVYDVISGSTPLDRWSAPAPGQTFLESATSEPGRLRIGWTTKGVMPGTRVDPEVVAATEATAEALAGLGHDVEHTDPRWPVPTAAFIPQFFAAIREETGIVEHPERLEWRTRSTARMGVWARPGVVAAAERAGERVAAALADRLAEWDVLLTPTIAPLPPPLGRLDGVGSLHAQVRSLPMIAFASILNVTGHPGISVPAGLSRDGWPIGVQLLTTSGDEGRLLSLAAQLEPGPALAAGGTGPVSVVELRRPPSLSRGDRVAVIAPSSPVPTARLDAGLAVLRGWGLDVVEGPHLRHTHPDLVYLASSDADRAADLTDAWLDPEVSAILCGRGGYGVPRLLDLLDWDRLARATPKPLVGFSDVTPLLHALGTRLGVAGVHGPAVTGIGDGDPASNDRLRRLLFADEPDPVLATDLATLVPGSAEGPLVGGNLALIASSIGTDDLLPARGAVVVLEDVDEFPFRLDRVLTQVLRSGWLDGVRAVVLGGFTNCGDPEQRRAMVLDRLGGLGVPLVGGAPIGHDRTNLAFWMGDHACVADGVLTVGGGAR